MCTLLAVNCFAKDSKFNGVMLLHNFDMKCLKYHLLYQNGYVYSSTILIAQTKSLLVHQIVMHRAIQGATKSPLLDNVYPVNDK